MSAVTDAEKAEALYVQSLAEGLAAADWQEAVLESRRRVFAALRSSRCLFAIEDCIIASGEHLTALRHMLGPPISQDQFALICPQYRKTCEKPGKSVARANAPFIALALRNLLDRQVTRWVGESRPPTIREVRLLVATVAPMLSLQAVATVRRNRMSAVQENNVIDLLRTMGWSRVSSGLVEQSSTLPGRHFMHKTRFATKTRPQEVDIACELGNSVVLAMECKVTNDRTNSVKRVNDILKKATAWQEHWGSFVKTAALLQGVVADKDVERLNAARVHVFWSHDLAKFREWLELNSL